MTELLFTKVDNPKRGAAMSSKRYLVVFATTISILLCSSPLLFAEESSSAPAQERDQISADNHAAVEAFNQKNLSLAEENLNKVVKALESEKGSELSLASALLNLSLVQKEEGKEEDAKSTAWRAERLLRALFKTTDLDKYKSASMVEIAGSTTLRQQEQTKSGAVAPEEPKAAVAIEKPAPKREMPPSDGKGGIAINYTPGSSEGSVQTVPGKKKNEEPDAIYLAMKTAKEKYDQGQYAQSLELLKAQLEKLSKTNKGGTTAFIIICDIELCLKKLKQEAQFAEFKGKRDGILREFKLAPLGYFEIVPLNEGSRAAVDLMVLLSGMRGDVNRHLKRDGDNWAISAGEAAPWMQEFATGAQLKQAGRYKEAEPHLEAAVRGAEHAIVEQKMVANTLSLLAGNYRYLGKYDQSIATYRKSLAIIEKSSGKNCAEYATVLDNMSHPYLSKGDKAQAAALQLEAIAIYKKVLPPDSIDLGQVFSNYAGTLHQLNRNAEAEKMYLDGIAIYKKKLPPDSPSLAITYDNLGAVYVAQQKFAEAEKIQRQALEILRAKLDSTHPELTICISNLANVLVLEQKDLEAQTLMENHLKELKQKRRDSPEVNEFLLQYGQMMDVIMGRKLKR